MSQSLLARLDCCPYSAALYCDFKGGPQTAPLARGEAFHDFAARATNMMIEQGEPTMPGDVARDLMQHVIEERTDLAVPGSEQDVLRAAAWHWGSATVLDLDSIVGVEIMLTMEVAGWTVRGRLDRAEIRDGVGYVWDWKTTMALPSREAFMQDFQTQCYAMLLAEGKPEGDDLPLGRGLNTFRLYNVFPRLLADDGSLLSRDATLDRADVADVKRTVEAHLAKLEAGLDSGKWIASPGSHCQTCSASAECPIPAAERDLTIGTPDDAREVCERIIRIDDEGKRLKKSAKGWVTDNDSVIVGDYIFELVPSTSEAVRDKDELKRALEVGGHDPTEFFQTRESTRFTKRKLRPEEIA